jgi:hypothetical protein
MAARFTRARLLLIFSKYAGHFSPLSPAFFGGGEGWVRGFIVQPVMHSLITVIIKGGG